MDERIRFISAHIEKLSSMTELCEEFGISRNTGYKWVARYAAEGGSGLEDRSRAPHCHGRRTPQVIEDAIVALRRERPTWGPRKIVAKLAERQPQVDWPAGSTAGEILKRSGLVCERRVKRRAPPRLGELTVPQHPNHVWGVDHKGWVRLGDGSRVEPLTMSDGFSRYGLSVSVGTSTACEVAQVVFEAAFETYGLPQVIRSDNGTPFASTGVTGLTTLSVWWLKLGIRHERIDGGQPQQNGRHERFHRTLLEAMHPPCADAAAQAARFAAFMQDYNEERPHEALGYRAPASLYRCSERRLPAHLPEPVYPIEAAVRQVRSNGEIKWRGDLIHISGALSGEAVAVEETPQGHWQVRFFDTPLGLIDQDNLRLRRLATPVHGGGEPTQIPQP